MMTALSCVIDHIICYIFGDVLSEYTMPVIGFVLFDGLGECFRSWSSSWSSTLEIWIYGMPSFFCPSHVSFEAEGHL